MKKIKFGTLLANWFVVAVVLAVLNMFFVKIHILNNIIFASLGVILLVYPVYPDSLKEQYNDKKCRTMIRIIAVIEIALAFWIRINF